MRRMGLWACMIVLSLGVQAKAQDDAKAIIEKAIEATGGAELLNKYPAGKMESRGTINVMGMDFDYEADSMYMMPDKVKNIIRLNVMGQEVTINQVINGDQAMMTLNGMETPLDDQQLNEAKKTALVQRLYQLTPLLENKEFTLEKLDGEIDVNGKAAKGVLVKTKKLGEVKLYFDANSGLMVKTERKGLDPNGAPASLSEVFLAYKEVNGLQRPTKITAYADDTKYMTVEVIKQEDLEKIPASEFSTGDN